MSIYHRYALYYNLRRYLGEIERLSELAYECDIVYDRLPYPPGLKITKKNPVSREESLPLGEDEKHEDQAQGDTQLDDQDSASPTEEDTSSEIQSSPSPEPDGSAHPCEEKSMDEEIEIDDNASDKTASEADSTENNRGSSTCSSDGGGSSRVGGSDVATANSDSSSYSSAGGISSPRVTITQAQLDRLLDCRGLLRTVVEGLLTNIYRVEAEQDDLSSRTIKHFWREAARLNGAERIKSPRVLEREVALGCWGIALNDDADDGGGDDDTVWDAASTAGSSVCSSSKSDGSRRHGSPLSHAFVPDDLIWEDQVQQWRLDMGRAMDDQGRRHLKI